MYSFQSIVLFSIGSIISNFFSLSIFFIVSFVSTVKFNAYTIKIDFLISFLSFFFKCVLGLCYMSVDNGLWCGKGKWFALFQQQITLNRFENSLCHVITKFYGTGQEKAFNLPVQMWNKHALRRYFMAELCASSFDFPDQMVRYVYYQYMSMYIIFF